MFFLTEDELELAFSALNHHGYSALLPHPPEWETVKSCWTDLRTHLASIDLDEYRPHTPMRVFVPKSRILLRPTTLLHPEDLLIYTALVLITLPAIESQRIAPAAKRVFSFRADPARLDRLYRSDDAPYQRYLERLEGKAKQRPNGVVAVADIADFYPRIYQHPLENVLKTLSTEQRIDDVARVLVRKFLLNVADGKSYGIPIGPLASRVLAEAVLIDVDAALMDAGFDFVRWVDDFNFFCRTEVEAQRALFFLSEWLFDKHGLSLQPHKTRILSVASFQRRLKRDYDARLRERSSLSRRMWELLQQSDYSDAETIALAEQELAKLDADDLVALLKEALADANAVDYQLADFVIGRLGSLQLLPDNKKVELIDTILGHVEHLYPLASSVARFFASFRELGDPNRKRIAKALLAPMKMGRRQPPDSYCMWVLNLFAESPEWNNAEDIRAIYSMTTSQIVKRYAALALAQTGTRSHALTVRSDFANASPLLKTAILLCTRKLGADERGHWKRLSGITGFLEKKL
jgi:hypothetical protein